LIFQDAASTQILLGNNVVTFWEKIVQFLHWITWLKSITHLVWAKWLRSRVATPAL
jgi:hypothetical protein